MKKSEKSYKDANPMRPDKKASAGENYKGANPYMGKKGKKSDKKGKNPIKG